MSLLKKVNKRLVRFVSACWNWNIEKPCYSKSSVASCTWTLTFRLSECLCSFGNFFFFLLLLLILLLFLLLFYYFGWVIQTWLGKSDVMHWYHDTNAWLIVFTWWKLRQCQFLDNKETLGVLCSTALKK